MYWTQIGNKIWGVYMEASGIVQGTQEIKQCKCLVCGHQWWPRTQARTKRCPNCDSTRWDKGPYTAEDRSEVAKRLWATRKETQKEVVKEEPIPTGVKEELSNSIGEDKDGQKTT